MALNGIETLEVEGIVFKVAYNGYTYGRNKIHSSNTGRTNSGTMVGTILAIKDKVEVTLVPMNPATAKEIDSVVSSTTMFHKANVLYLDGTSKELEIYFGDVSYHYLSRNLGDNGLITGVSVSLIER